MFIMFIDPHRTTHISSSCIFSRTRSTNCAGEMPSGGTFPVRLNSEIRPNILAISLLLASMDSILGTC